MENICRCFNPRSHAGSDWTIRRRYYTYMMFQSTLPRRERPGRVGCLVDYSEVSIHAPTQGATAKAFVKGETSKSFNPRSHAGSDGNVSHTLHLSIVSIHAPTQGGTVFPSCPSGNITFQSTLPRRERHARSFIPHIHNKVSIHAPTQGATSAGYTILNTPGFQSTLPRRERLKR